MKKMRVYEYAKENNLKSKDVIEYLQQIDIEVSNHMSTITENAIRQLDNLIKGKDKQQTENNQQVKKEQEKPAPQKKEQKQQNKPSGNKVNNSSGNKVNKRNENTNKPNQNRSSNKPKNKKSTKQKGNRQNRNVQKEQQQVAKTPDKITFEGSLTVGELAQKLNKEASVIIKQLMLLGVAATINEQLDKDTIELICSEFNVEVEEIIPVDLADLSHYIDDDNEEQLIERPAVVTIMGHVDHGKTTLLDSIRDSKVSQGEAGGITQHIGAYQIEMDNKKITFLDTPGHEAFTSMRSRGAQVTDIAILVVAADDGVMPQTVEAINHAKAAEVPIIVAVNKIDKETADPNRVMQELMEHELVPEDWGGDTIFVPLSALQKQGIDDLLEMINLVAEVEELKANPNRPANGTVIEAELDKGRGSVATLLVQNGTLKVGDTLVIGNTYGKVRAMVDDLGKRVNEAGPSTPVEVIGFNEVPKAGDQFVVFKDEREAKRIADMRLQRFVASQREESGKLSLDDLFKQIQEGDVKDINVIIKADVQGSVEALHASLQKIEVEGVKIKIIHTGVGAITESDIILASASNAIVIGFNVRPDVNAKRMAESENIDIRLHRVIYKAIEEMEAAMKGMLDPEYEEKVIGQVEVRETFKVSKIGTIAGSYVTDGKITRNSGVRVIRDGVVIFEGELDSLKRFKDDVREVAQGYECGITITNFNDIKVGDIIEAFVMEEIERT